MRPSELTFAKLTKLYSALDAIRNAIRRGGRKHKLSLQEFQSIYTFYMLENRNIFGPIDNEASNKFTLSIIENLKCEDIVETDLNRQPPVPDELDTYVECCKIAKMPRG